ncbi:efflux RND transporter permease subunit [uncultured Desulfuromonas sp.]|uniref:efflux RND transporter permease subunit n=1 Tax=uncultured Desulfuromonas sp. TaxID=181013 RepID=UPI002613B86E|nr:efflux RND transporter permease subunit [uncultured Desulfuromonas sp.]
MDVVRFSIEKPVTVIVGVILLLMFGTLALMKMPYQLSPTVTEPEITVRTVWSGATPYEIERDIVEEQEKVLKGIPDLRTMESQCFNGQGEIVLRFAVGTEIDSALLRVSNKLDEVPSYPENVDKPVLKATGSASSPVIWMVMKTRPGNEAPINTYFTYFENDIRQHLERVRGVADLFVFGGTEKEMHVVVDPAKLAGHGLTVSDVIGVLGRENVNVAAGNLGVGRRDYRIRTVAEFRSPEAIGEIVLASTGQTRIRVRDVAEVGFGYEKLTAAMMQNGRQGIAIGVQPEVGTNILEMTDQVKEVVDGLNAGVLKERGIHLDWAYDQRPYINGAIDLVQLNIAIGGVLAVIVLLLFLRSLSSTAIVAFAIPISVIGTFIFMRLFGRNLNVVSLAGISFAVGMLVDNAIVVLENIDRHRGMDKSPFAAAYDGTREVWGAILASTLTTIAVFLPVVFIEEEAGQLFKDIAIAVTCAIALSLFVSVSVIPMVSRQIFALRARRSRVSLQGIDRAAGKVADGIMTLVGLATGTVPGRLVTIAGLTAAAVAITVVFFPKMEYLPQGNRNLLINILIPPPGLSYEERKAIGEKLFDDLAPHFEGEVDGLPRLENVFYVGAEQISLFGAIAEEDQRARELIPLMSREVNSFPGVFGVSLQAGIFQDRIGGGRTIDVDISGARIESLVPASGAMFGAVMQAIPGSQVRPLPSFEVLYPEVNLVPRRDRLIASGMSAGELGVNVDVLMDGRKIGDFKEEGEKTIDLVLKAPETGAETPEALYATQVATPLGTTVPLSSLAELQRSTGLTQIRHLERKRTFTLQVTPPEQMPLQQAMETIEEEVIPGLEEAGLLKGLSVRLAGAADKLTVTREAMQWNFLLALVITYLLMSALFANFVYPLIILFTVPLAGAGGFLGLKLTNWFIAPQPLDILTMLGFVILIGVVVNNAILIVHQSLNNVREHALAHREAVMAATRTRLRPIYMSATTSIFGMLPLVVAPGPGSELYRGLGSVVLGGLALSTVFTIFVIPALLMFFIRMERTGPRQ